MQKFSLFCCISHHSGEPCTMHILGVGGATIRSLSSEAPLVCGALAFVTVISAKILSRMNKMLSHFTKRKLLVLVLFANKMHVLKYGSLSMSAIHIVSTGFYTYVAECTFLSPVITAILVSCRLLVFVWVALLHNPTWIASPEHLYWSLHPTSLYCYPTSLCFEPVHCNLQLL